MDGSFDPSLDLVVRGGRRFGGVAEKGKDLSQYVGTHGPSVPPAQHSQGGKAPRTERNSTRRARRTRVHEWVAAAPTLLACYPLLVLRSA